MYKLFIFLKSNEKEIIENFSSSTLALVKNLNAKYHFGKIEGSALTEDKFTYLIEIITNNSDEMNKLLVSPNGKNLLRDLSNYMNNVTTFTTEFKD